MMFKIYYIREDLLNATALQSTPKCTPSVRRAKPKRNARNTCPLTTKAPVADRGLLFHMAERVGFEPTEVTSLAGFQDQSLKPLDHLSESTIWIIIEISVSVNRRAGNAFIALR